MATSRMPSTGRYWTRWAPEWRETADGIEIDGETAGDLDNVCRSDAADACATGFSCYAETAKFATENRDLIRERIHEQIADGLFSDGEDDDRPKSVIGAVMPYHCLADHVAYAPDEMEEAIARVFFGPVEDVTEKGETGDDLHIVANALAWGALEDLAHALADARCDD